MCRFSRLVRSSCWSTCPRRPSARTTTTTRRKPEKPELGEPNDLLSENSNYLEFGADASRRQDRWRAFLLDEDPKEAAVMREEGQVGEPLFRGEALPHHSRLVGRGRGRPKKAEKTEG